MDTKQKQAFLKELYENNHKWVLVLAYQKTKDRETAQDIAQEVFLTAQEKIDDVINSKNPPGWLYKATIFKVMHERRKAYHREVPLETLALHGCDVYEEQYNRLEHILPKELKERDKELLTLRHEEQWEYDQLAEYLGITQDNCRQRMSRLHRKCKVIFENRKNLSQKP